MTKTVTIVERLREAAKYHTFEPGDMREAADAIERLTKQRDEAEAALQSLQNRWASRPLSDPDLIAENERLRDLLLTALDEHDLHKGRIRNLSLHWSYRAHEYLSDEPEAATAPHPAK